jgi:hypothetical protein
MPLICLWRWLAGWMQSDVKVMSESTYVISYVCNARADQATRVGRRPRRGVTPSCKRSETTGQLGDDEAHCLLANAVKKWTLCGNGTFYF